MIFTFFVWVCRSISLVGEKERKILKEIVKQAKNPVKSRILPPGQWVWSVGEVLGADGNIATSAVLLSMCNAINLCEQWVCTSMQ